MNVVNTIDSGLIENTLKDIRKR